MVKAKRETFTWMLDTSRRPHIPEGWDLGSHTTNGVLSWSPAYNTAELIQHDVQRHVEVRGDLIHRVFRFRRFLNARVLDCLRANPSLYPEDWKADKDGGPKFVTFMGTFYLQPHDRRWVRYSYWDHNTGALVDDIIDMSQKWHGKRTYAAVLKQLSSEREGAIG